MSPTSLLPADISVAALIVILVVALGAGMARGFSGFGAALIFMPLASAIVAPQIAAAVLMLIDLVAAPPLIPNAWRHARRGTVAALAFGAAFGVPLGAFTLTRLDPMTTRWLISGFVLALLALLISGWRYSGGERPVLAIGVGGVAGFCGGLAQSGGPPIIAYQLGQPVSAVVARANIVLYFAATGIFSAVSYFAGGLLTSGVIRLALIVGPIYALGLFLGARMFGLASEAVFRRVCYGLIALAAVIGLPLLDGVLR